MKGELSFTPEYGYSDDEDLWNDLMKVREAVESAEGDLSDKEWEQRTSWKVLEGNPSDLEGKRVGPSEISEDNDKYIAKVHLTYNSPEHGSIETEYWNHDYFWVNSSSEYWDSIEEVFDEEINRGIINEITQGLLEPSVEDTDRDEMVTSYGVPGFRIGRYIESSDGKREYGHRIRVLGVERRFTEGTYETREDEDIRLSKESSTREMEKEK